MKSLPIGDHAGEYGARALMHHYTFTLYALGVEILTGTLSSVKNVDTAILAATPLATTKLTGESNAKPD
jgi:phosphatidylethanolamine-binding protein (PEBP) family uncharacterized protein